MTIECSATNGGTLKRSRSIRPTREGRARRLPRALFAARLVVRLCEPAVIGGGIAFFDVAQPLGSDRVRDDRRQPVVGARLGDGIEALRAVVRRAHRAAPRRRIDERYAGRVALELEDEGELAPVLISGEQALAP